MSEVATLSPAAPGPGQSNGMTKRERRNWFLALLVAFALGFLLACNLAPRQVLRANCPRPDDKGPPLAMNGSTSGHGSRGRGSPEKIGSPGEETGDHVGKGYATAVEGGGGTPGSGSNGDASSTAFIQLDHKDCFLDSASHLGSMSNLLAFLTD